MHETEILATSDCRWVIKSVSDTQRSTDELRIILAMLDKKPRHSIELPPAYGLYGRTPEAGWFALKRYSGHVEVDPYCKNRWRILAIHILQFLQDFHHDHGMAHMDIKKSNILIDRDTHEFVVTDYEHAERPHARRTSVYDADYVWYYMAMGAEMDQPLVSWRFDLVALGYVLASLTVTSDWTFEKICWNKRKGKGGGMSTDEVLALRSNELQGADPVVLAYMDRVKEVAWDATVPPRDFYKSLEALFA